MRNNNKEGLFKVPNSLKIKVIKLHNDLNLPCYATSSSSGLDLFAAINEPISLSPGSRVRIPTGIKIALPSGYEAQVRSRSGLAIKHGVIVLNSPGTIDSDYRGEIEVILINLSDIDYLVNRGDRIAQMVISQVTKISWKNVTDFIEQQTERGEGGFGSTGT